MVEWLSGTAPGGMVPKNGERVEEAASGEGMNSMVDDVGGASGTTGTEWAVGKRTVGEVR